MPCKQWCVQGLLKNRGPLSSESIRASWKALQSELESSGAFLCVYLYAASELLGVYTCEAEAAGAEHMLGTHPARGVVLAVL